MRAEVCAPLKLLVAADQALANELRGHFEALGHVTLVADSLGLACFALERTQFVRVFYDVRMGAARGHSVIELLDRARRASQPCEVVLLVPHGQETLWSQQGKHLVLGVPLDPEALRSVLPGLRR
jgi:DNA-binding NtrC family response regulator